MWENFVSGTHCISDHSWGLYCWNYAQIWTTKLHNFLFLALGSFGHQLMCVEEDKLHSFFPNSLLSIARVLHCSIFMILYVHS